MAAHRQYNSYKSHVRAQKGSDHYHPVLGVGRAVVARAAGRSSYRYTLRKRRPTRARTTQVSG